MDLESILGTLAGICPGWHGSPLQNTNQSDLYKLVSALISKQFLCIKGHCACIHMVKLSWYNFICIEGISNIFCVPL